MITREEVRKKLATKWLMNPSDPFTFKNRLLEEKYFDEVMDLIFKEGVEKPKDL